MSGKDFRKLEHLDINAFCLLEVVIFVFFFFLHFSESMEMDVHKKWHCRTCWEKDDLTPKRTWVG